MIFNSHAGHNPDGKVGCGAIGLIKESTENRNVNSELIRQLTALKHTIYDCTVNDGTSSSNVLSKIVAKCNAHDVDWDISIHFNAGASDKSGNGRTTGIEVLIYNLNDTETKNKANAICNELAALGFKNRGVKQRQDLYVLRKTKAKAMLIECCFVDDADDVKLYQSLGTKKFVAAIVKGLTGQVLQEITTTTTTTEVKKLYRVRKSKDDAKSQVGAYTSLDNAKAACQSAGAGYHVFDWNFNKVYSYTAPQPVTPIPTPTPTPEPEKVIEVYNLDYPEKHLIVNKAVVTTKGINQEECAKAIKKILQNNPNFDINIAKAFFKLAPIYNIDPMMAISQSILETGWFKFEGSDAKAKQNNFCGLGVTGGGVSGATFNTIEDGIKAQLQHLYAYGCKDELPSGEITLLDPRFHLVTRGIAIYWQQLAGRWAVPGYDKNTYSTPQKAMEAGNTYGQKIRTIYNQLVGTTITDEDIKEIFDEGEDVVEPTDDNIVVLIIDCIKKLIEFLTTYLSKKDV